MSLIQALLQDMHTIETELSQFESKFGVLSQDFYVAMTRGDLEEFDALDDYRMDFVHWMGLYETWGSFNGKYRQLIDRQPVAMQIKTNLEPSYA